MARTGVSHRCNKPVVEKIVAQKSTTLHVCNTQPWPEQTVPDTEDTLCSLSHRLPDHTDYSQLRSLGYFTN